jgi:hypothetical protein
MSAIVEANKQEYLKLMKLFLKSEIDGRSFQSMFLEMWRRDRDESYSKVKSWSRRYDRDLMERRLRGEITGEEFSKRWHDLWGYEPTRWLEIQDRLFRDVDRFEPDKTVYKTPKQDPDPYNAAYYITEEELREKVKEYLSDLDE